MAVMRELAHSGITMLVVTHEMGFAREVADRLIFFDEGVILEDTTPQAFFSNPDHERARLPAARRMGGTEAPTAARLAATPADMHEESKESSRYGQLLLRPDEI